jgi:transcriptional regulator with XRE-family HTH domain
MIGVTFQQVQKYERGANRIGASRLNELSRVLARSMQDKKYGAIA